MSVHTMYVILANPDAWHSHGRDHFKQYKRLYQSLLYTKEFDFDFKGWLIFLKKIMI